MQASREFANRMRAVGGDVIVDVLPEAGIHGNGHTLAIERNNREIMFRMSARIQGHITQ
jgi:hypothetical protein